MRNSTILVYSETGPISPFGRAMSPFASVAVELAVDLICHDVITVGQEKLLHDFDADTYYVCSPICQKHFTAEPEGVIPALRAAPGHIDCSGDNHATD